MLMRPAQSIHVGLVEVEQILPILDKGINDCLLLKSLVSQDRIVDGDAAQLVVVVVVGCDECIGEVRHVEARVRFACDVRGGALQFEGVDKVAPKTDELEAKLDLVGDIGDALAEADADWLLNPDYVGTSYSSQCLQSSDESGGRTDWSSCKSSAWETWSHPATGMDRSQSRDRSGSCSPGLH